MNSCSRAIWRLNTTSALLAAARPGPSCPPRATVAQEFLCARFTATAGSDGSRQGTGCAMASEPGATKAGAHHAVAVKAISVNSVGVHGCIVFPSGVDESQGGDQKISQAEQQASYRRLVLGGIASVPSRSEAPASNGVQATCCAPCLRSGNDKGGTAAGHPRARGDDEDVAVGTCCQRCQPDQAPDSSASRLLPVMPSASPAEEQPDQRQQIPKKSLVHHNKPPGRRR
jgi:hypothetical protein